MAQQTLAKAREQLRFSRGFSNLLDTLGQISLGNYYALKKSKDEFSSIFLGYMKDLIGFLPDVFYENSPLVHLDKNVQPTYILFTSDSGLLGGLNQRTIRVYEEAILGNRDCRKPFVVGEKGIHLMQSRMPIVPIVAENSDSLVKKLVEEVLVDSHTNGNGGIYALYPRSISLTNSEVDYTPILPCSLFKTSERKIEHRARAPILESDPSEIVDYLVRQWLDYSFQHILEETRLAEYAARSTHLESSCNHLEKNIAVEQDLVKKIRKSLVDKQGREAAAAQQVIKKRKARRGVLDFAKAAVF